MSETILNKIKDIRERIQHRPLTEVMDHLEEVVNDIGDQDLINKVLQLNIRAKDIKDRFVLLGDDNIREKNRLNYSIIELLTEIEQFLQDPEAAIEARPVIRDFSRLTSYVINFGILLLFIGFGLIVYDTPNPLLGMCIQLTGILIIFLSFIGFIKLDEHPIS